MHSPTIKHHDVFFSCDTVMHTTGESRKNREEDIDFVVSERVQAAKLIGNGYKSLKRECQRNELKYGDIFKSQDELEYFTMLPINDSQKCIIAGMLKH